MERSIWVRNALVKGNYRQQCLKTEMRRDGRRGGLRKGAREPEKARLLPGMDEGERKALALALASIHPFVRGRRYDDAGPLISHVGMYVHGHGTGSLALMICGPARGELS